MILSFIDRVLLILLAMEVVCATSGRALADPPAPPICDEKCRERRFFQERVYDPVTELYITDCLMSRWRDCDYCSSAGTFMVTLCSPNVIDTYTDKPCSNSTKDQEIANPAPTECNSLCPIPVYLVAYYLEAAEGPSTYDSITGWAAANRKVKKCTNTDGKTITWDDEKNK